MKRITKILEIVFMVIMISLCAMILLAGSGKVPYVFGYRVLQVISDSMKPTISDETCIVIKKVDKEDIKVGDIITFVSEAPDIRGYLNTHRVHDIVKDAETGEMLFITKGDAYDSPDDYPVEYEQVAGRYVRELPFGELLFKGIRFLSDSNHYFIIVILPLSLCCFSYLKDMYYALFGKGKDNEKDEAAKEETDTEDGKDAS